MKKITLLGLLLFVAALPAFGQSTTVSGTVQDLGSQTWNNGSIEFDFVPNPQYPSLPQYTWTGGTLSYSVKGTLGGSGTYSVSVPTNSAITPGGSQWTIKVCSLATFPCYTTTPATITGATQTINVTPPAISINLVANPTASAYVDGEISGAILGSTYFNLTSSLQRLCTALTSGACSTWANNGTGGSTVYPSGTGITTVTGGSAWGTTLTGAAAGDLIYYNGSAWAKFAGNSGATNCLTENTSGVPSWATCGSGGGGTVTSFAAPSGSWPSWLVPTVTNSTTTPSLAVAASSIPNNALAFSSITIAGTPISLGGSTSSFPSPGAIGGTTPAAGTFTTLTANTSFTLNGGTAQTGTQGTDTKLLTAGTVSGTAANLCTDANGGATTSGCTSGGNTTSTSLTSGYYAKANGANSIVNGTCDSGISTANTFTCSDTAGASFAEVTVTGGSNAGADVFTAGTAQGHATASTVTLEAPTSVTAYEVQLPTAAGTGLNLWTNSAGVVAQSLLASAAAGDLVVGNGTTWTKFAGNASGTNCLQENSSGVASWASCGSGSFAFPITVSGTTTSGGIPYFSNTTTLTSSALLATNHVLLGGGAGGAPTSDSNLDDGATTANTLTYAGSAGISAKSLTTTGSSAGALVLTQGTANSAGTTNITIQAPTSVTSYTLALPSAAASGVPVWSNSSGTVTESISTAPSFSALNCGVASTTACVITGQGSTSGTATLTWPAVAGTATNPIVSSNVIQVPQNDGVHSTAGYSFSSCGATVFCGMWVINGSSHLVLSAGGSGNIYMEPNDAATFTFTTGGELQPVAVGTQTIGDATNYLSKVYSNNYYAGTGATAGITAAVVCNSTFGSTNGLVTTCTNTSDPRLKNIEGTLKYGLKEVNAVTPITFKWNDLAHNLIYGLQDDSQIGFNAEELQSVMPEIVGTENHDGVDYRTIKSDRALIATLWNAVKQQQAQVEELKRQVEELKAKVQ